MEFKKIIKESDLPEPNKYVIGKHNRGTWVDPDDQENVNTVIVKLVKGISKKERMEMSDDNPRKTEWRKEDENGNNILPYIWETFGPDCFFGHSITHWCEIPKLTEK